MIPTEDFQNKKAFDLKGAAGKADHITIYFNAGHPGVEVPHYHIVVWHVSKKRRGTRGAVDQEILDVVPREHLTVHVLDVR